MSIFRMSTPPHTNAMPLQKRKAPLLKTFWERFWPTSRPAVLG